MNKSRWKWGIGTMVVGAGFACLAWYLRTPERLLLERSQPVIDLGAEMDSDWLSDSLLILITTDTAPETAPDNWQGHAELLETQSGRRTPLSGLMERLKQLHGAPWQFIASPDGRWLKWDNIQTMDGWPSPVIARWDGSHVRQLHQEKFSSAYWLDGSHWVEETAGEEPAKVKVYDVENPKNDRRYLVDSLQGSSLIAQHEQVNPDTVRIDWNANALKTNRAKIEQHTKNASAPIRTYEVQLPPEAEVQDAIVSPQEQVIVYSLRFEALTPLDRLLQRLFPKRKVSPRNLASLWVSRVDGTGLHEIGHVPMDAKDSTGREKLNEIEELQWLPGGHRLSYVYNHTLYTVSATEIGLDSNGK